MEKPEFLETFAEEARGLEQLDFGIEPANKEKLSVEKYCKEN